MKLNKISLLLGLTLPFSILSNISANTNSSSISSNISSKHSNKDNEIEGLSKDYHFKSNSSSIKNKSTKSNKNLAYKNTDMYKFLQNHPNQQVLEVKVQDMNNSDGGSSEIEHFYLVGNDNDLNNIINQLNDKNRSKYIINGLTAFDSISTSEICRHTEKSYKPYEKFNNNSLTDINFWNFKGKDTLVINYKKLNNKQMQQQIKNQNKEIYDIMHKK